MTTTSFPATVTINADDSVTLTLPAYIATAIANAVAPAPKGTTRVI